MNGRSLGGNITLALVLVGLVGGCGEARTEPEASPPPTPRQAGACFDAATAGEIKGQVRWQGALPNVPPFQVRLSLQPGVAPRHNMVCPHPNAPKVDPSSREVAGAVIFLRGIDPERGRPWDLPPVRVEQTGWRILIRQGNGLSSVGFVRQGDLVEMVSRDPLFHSLRAKGAVFFSLAFPDPDQPLRRQLPDKGVVELASGAGFYWMRGYLFVADHPYYTLTDAQGRFTLPQVPPGRYELVCWLPSWREERHERDPETGLVIRLFFAPPVQLRKTVQLGRREKQTVDFDVRTKDFEP